MTRTAEPSPAWQRRFDGVAWTLSITAFRKASRFSLTPGRIRNSNPTARFHYYLSDPKKRENILDFLWLKDESHGWHGGDLEVFVAFGEFGVGFDHGAAQVVGVLARGDGIHGWADGAALSVEGVAEDAGAGRVFEEDFLTASGVAGL